LGLLAEKEIKLNDHAPHTRPPPAPFHRFAASVRVSAASPMRNADFSLLPVLSLDETFEGLENGIPTVRRDDGHLAECVVS
jgi:hypothetical protein